MSNLPKSLHTVRILAAVALNEWQERGLGGPMRPADAVRFACDAGRILGYPDTASDDPLVVKAVAQLCNTPLDGKLDPPGYAKRVRQLEKEGLTTSDAQGVADAEFRQGVAA